jgi:hypothetical protein
LLFHPISHVFGRTIEDILRSSGWILTQDSVLETPLFIDYTIKISRQNLWNLIAKFGSKAEIC